MKLTICLLLVLSLGTATLAQSSVAPEGSGETVTVSSTTTSVPSSSSEDPQTSSTRAPATTTQSTTTSAPEPTTASTPEPTTTSRPPPTTTSTPEPTTTSRPPPTTTSTPEPTTSTPKPTTTSTPEPTTTSTPEPTTTSRRPTTTTSTTPPTTPTPVAPIPPAFPQNVGNWSYTEHGLKSPCILLKGAIQLHVTRNKTNPSDQLVVDVPNSPDHVKVFGTCAGDNQTVIINWWSKVEPGSTAERNNTLSIEFAKHVEQNYALMSVIYKYNPGHQFDITGPFFETTLQRSFRCKSKQQVKNDEATFYMLTQDLQFEAFRQEDVAGAQFSSADECKADNGKSTGVVLGIAVGIGLLIVVVISLGIYLFKRFRRGGYQPLVPS